MQTNKHEEEEVVPDWNLEQLRALVEISARIRQKLTGATKIVVFETFEDGEGI